MPYLLLNFRLQYFAKKIYVTRKLRYFYIRNLRMGILSLFRKLINKKRKRRRDRMGIFSKRLKLKRRYQFFKHIFLIHNSLILLKILVLKVLFFNYIFYYNELKKAVLSFFGYLKSFWFNVILSKLLAKKNFKRKLRRDSYGRTLPWR